MQANFLEAIEGTSGERLASSILQFLITNSATFRDRLVVRIAAHVPPGYAPSFRNGVYCQTEYATQDQAGNQGFIDLLIGDGLSTVSAAAKFSFAMAIEVKLWAKFTPEQPAKYYHTLREMVGGEKEKLRCSVVVLAPSDRKYEVERHLSSQECDPRAIVWNWNDIRDDLKFVSEGDATPLAMVAQWFLRFLDARLGSLQLQGTPASYVGSQVIIGNAYQVDFLNKLKGCLPGPSRMSCQSDYFGLRCPCVDAETPGVVPAIVSIEFAKHNAQVIFGIDTPLPPPATDTEFEFKKWDRLFQKLEFDPALKSALEWRDKLTPMLAEIQRRHSAARVASASA